jgi:3-oxoacyl-[acyl-carrier protein] reductase
MVAEKHITRIGEPEDIAGLIAFILSPQGSYLQGALIDMDGGRTKGI